MVNKLEISEVAPNPEASQKVIFTNLRIPSPNSPNADIKAVAATKIIAPENINGPEIASAKVCNEVVNGKLPVVLANASADAAANTKLSFNHFGARLNFGEFNFFKKLGFFMI